LTGYDNNYQSDVVLRNKIDYARTYGWELIVKEDGDFNKERPAAYSKVPWILEYMKDYDLIFWNDFDSIFMNFTIDITDGLGENYIGMYEESSSYFCAGNMLIKSGKEAENFYRSIMTFPSWNNMLHPWEQRSINERCALNLYKGIKRFTKKEFGAFQVETGWAKEPWETGDFMLHLCSKDNTGNVIPWSDRMKLFEEKYRKLII